MLPAVLDSRRLMLGRELAPLPLGLNPRGVPRLGERLVLPPAAPHNQPEGDSGAKAEAGDGDLQPVQPEPASWNRHFLSFWVNRLRLSYVLHLSSSRAAAGPGPSLERFAF